MGQMGRAPQRRPAVISEQPLLIGLARPAPCVHLSRHSNHSKGCNHKTIVFQVRACFFGAPLRGELPPSGVRTPADAGERPRQMFAKGYGWSATA